MVRHGRRSPGAVQRKGPRMTTAIEAGLQRALELARLGPAVGPNLQVGCVLLDEAGRIVGEGHHLGAGTPHAETAAIADAAARGVDTRGLTAVVTLEPCNHHGRTGPCSEALIAAGIRAVHYAVPDPGNSSSGGARRLADAGIAVQRLSADVAGVADAEDLVEVWAMAVRRGRPWVTVKWASTLDGRAAAADGSSQWITGPESRRRVHLQRMAADAILVGTGTVLADDPNLTARDGDGGLLPHQPLPVVVGRRPVPAEAALHRHPAGLWESGTRDLEEVFGELQAREVRRVYVEGGPTVTSAVIAGGWADEFAVFLAPALLGGPRTALGDLGIPTLADILRLDVRDVERLGPDLLITARSAAHPAARSLDEGV